MSSSVLVRESVELDQLAAPDPMCRATVVVPARNEEDGLANCLDALRLQTTSDGEELPKELYEVILLLNNCTDRSGPVAERYALDHPEFRLHVAHCELPTEHAHVGMARHLLMECACARLEALPKVPWIRAILSSDADTSVASDWIVCNLAELEQGAEVVGGVIHLHPEELEALEDRIRVAYLRDRDYQARVAQLEALLDPDPADPWPRHLEHFGASLGCTPEVYRRCGGLPPVSQLEDLAFVDALRKVDAKIRHSPTVHIFTSARLEGRAEVGLSGQFRHWKNDADCSTPHLVDSAAWLEHRFRTMALLRQVNQGGRTELSHFPESWRERILHLQKDSLTTPRFLELLDCNSLIEEMYLEHPVPRQRRAEIQSVIAALDEQIAELYSPP